MLNKSWRDKRCYWLALHLIPRLGNIGFKNLLEKFKDPESVFQAGLSDLTSVEGVRPTIARKILGREYTTDPEEYLKQVQKHRARIILYSDSAYPQALTAFLVPSSCRRRCISAA